MLDLLVPTTAQGLLWAVMALGVYITYRVLDIADLTVEGSFPLGAAVAASMLSAGYGPIPSFVVAAIAGMVAGVVTALLHTKMKIPALLAGILTMIALYSVNLRVMGKANLSLLGTHTNIGKAITLRNKSTRNGNKRIAKKQTNHNGNISINALSSNHVLVKAGSTNGSANFSTEEPINEYCNQNSSQKTNNQSGVCTVQAQHFSDDGKSGISTQKGKVSFTHNTQVYGVQRNHSQDTC